MLFFLFSCTKLISFHYATSSGRCGFAFFYLQHLNSYLDVEFLALTRDALLKIPRKLSKFNELRTILSEILLS